MKCFTVEVNGLQALATDTLTDTLTPRRLKYRVRSPATYQQTADVTIYLYGAKSTGIQLCAHGQVRPSATGNDWHFNAELGE
jgi:hypothetical protein